MKIITSFSIISESGHSLEITEEKIKLLQTQIEASNDPILKNFFKKAMKKIIKSK